MAFSNPTKNASGNWVVTFTQNGASATKTLSTKNTYVDGDIILNANAADAVVFGNEPVSGKTADSYTNIDSSAPVLISGGYLFINEGYIQDSKISLAKLVPDGSDVAGHGDYILSGHSAYDNAGVLVAGTISTLAMDSSPLSSYYTSTNTGYGKLDVGYVNAVHYIKSGALSNGTASFTGGGANSTTTITAISSSPANKGAAVNYNDNKCGGSSEAAYYVTIAASGTGGAAAITASGSTGVGTAGWIPTSSTASVSGTKNAVSTTSSDTNYIKASAGGSVTGNSGSFTTSAAITATTTSPANKGAAVNYNDNKCGGSSEAAYYVTISATSNGSGSAGTAKDITVKDTYMLDNLSVTAPAPTKGTSTGDTNYIKASAGGSMAGNAVTNVANATATASGSVTAGSSYFASSGTTSYSVTFTATASASASATSTDASAKTYSIKDTYMLADASVVSKGNSTAATDSDSDSADITKYIIAGAYSASTQGSATVTPSATTNMATISQPSSGTEGTDYFSITPSGSVTANTITGKATIGTAGWIPTGSATGGTGSVSAAAGTKLYVAKAVLTASGSVSVSGSSTLTPSGVSVANKDAAVTGKSQITISPTTATTGISKYYVAVNATSSKINATNVSVSGTGTGTASVSTAGYAPDTLTGTGSISASGNASVTVNAKTGSTYYAPIATIGLSASGTASGSGSATPASVSVAKTTVPSGVTNAASGDATSTAPSSGVYVAVAGTSAAVGSTNIALSGTASAAVSTSGYGTAGTETGSGSVTGTATFTVGSKTGSTYYVPITIGSATTPATTITSNPGMSGAISGSSYVVTATNSKTQNVTPTVSAGWVASGTAGTVTVGGSNTFSIAVYNGEVA